MQYRTFGKTDWQVSEVGFGAWAIGGAWGAQNDRDSIAALHKAIDLGVNFIDTAQGYGNGKSEKMIAEVLKDRSETVYVATKSPPDSGPWPPSPYCAANKRYSETYLRKNVEERLRNLQTECLDILQLHTWTRAWNKNPEPFDILKQLKSEGKIRFVGISTPEHDQNSVIDLMRQGYVDVVQVIFNIFEQEPVAELLPAAKEHRVAIIVRVAFDEGVLTGKYNDGYTFPADDFRSKYFQGDRLERAVRRVEKIKEDIQGSDLTMPEVALKYALSHPAVSTVIPGIRNVTQAIMNATVSDIPDLSWDLLQRLHNHAWRRAFWYEGK
jgi:aryl-alcohol dehydrogenase-like predicted oxidoreductase